MANMYKESERKTFDFFLKGLSIPDASKPIKLKAFNDPNSIEVKLILYIYSMEPPFYQHLNTACRKKDKSKLKQLGPFAAAICTVLDLGYLSE